MTDEDWQTCTDPDELIIRMPANLSGRKFALVLCASWRHVWHLASAETRGAIERLEHTADRLGREGRWFADEWSETDPPYTSNHYISAQFKLIRSAGVESAIGEVARDWPGDWLRNQEVDEFMAAVARREKVVAEAERLYQLRILRDIFGNCYPGPTGFEQRWLTPDVAGIAQAMYVENDFDRLPVLGDAFEDAGCTDCNVLDHCHCPGEHTRGCWVVDLVLGKE